MRIWDVPVKELCYQHLIAEHRELHGLWNILTKHKGKGGYSHHPETLRWAGKLKALYSRHEKLVAEMEKRDYQHRSPLNKRLATGKARQNVLLASIARQRQLLKQKNCTCFDKKCLNKK